MTRKEARDLVFKILYQIDIQNEFDNYDLVKYIKDKDLADQESYVENLIDNVAKNKQEIDTFINENSKGWPLSRIAKVDLAILRLAICEMKYFDGTIPSVVSINEAVELAKTYGSEKSAGFVNAILGKCN